MEDARFVGRYEIRERVGQGGMAAVYSAYDPSFKRMVAIKLLPTQFHHDTRFRKRFEREATAIAGLEHPAIVPVYDYGEDEGQVFLVMRLMDGGSLAQRIERTSLSPKETSRILQRIAQAVDFAHQQGVVHRDLKPANILFDRYNEPYLTDFGIVKLLGGDATAVTKTGGLIGTPGYMSPEQVRGESDIDGRSDIYSLGVVCFEMLTGELPFQADSAMSLAFMHVTEPPPSLSARKPNLGRGYDAVINAAMAKERNNRFQSAAQLAEAFAAVESGAQFLPPTIKLGTESAEQPKFPMWAGVMGGIFAIGMIIVILAALIMLPRLMAGQTNTSEPTTVIEKEIVTQVVVATSAASEAPTQTSETGSTAAPTNTLPPTLESTFETSPTPTADIPDFAPTLTESQENTVIFSSNRDGDYELFSLNILDNSLRQLTNNSASDWGPDWSPDGTKVVYHSNQDGFYSIFLLDLADLTSTRLTDPSYEDYWPSWSFDGERIAFHSNRSGNYQIFVMNVDGTNQTQITNSASDNYWPSWSPSNDRLVFSADRGGNVDIYTIDLATREERRLTTHTALDYAPVWSADGAKIAWHSERDGNNEIYVMNADGSNQTRLTFNSVRDESPDWSRMGDRITFFSFRDGNIEIYLMNADGSNQRRLTRANATDRDPVFPK